MNLSKATTLVACTCQFSLLPVRADWFRDPLGVRISSNSFVDWIKEDALKELVCGISANPIRIQDSRSPTGASSSLLCSRLRLRADFELVKPLMDRLAIGRTPRNWAFAAATLYRNLIDDITLLGLILYWPYPVVCVVYRARIGGLGGGAQIAVGCCPWCTPRRKHIYRTAATAPGCASKCPRWLSCEPKAAARRRGLDVFLNTFSYFPHCGRCRRLQAWSESWSP